MASAGAGAASTGAPGLIEHHTAVHPKLPKKWVFRFGSKGSDGNRSMKATLGGKGANLAEMASLGLPVPPGFTITAEACEYVTEHAGELPEELVDQADHSVEFLEEEMGAKFGATKGGKPLLLSVRSGAAISMPGMMDTVLNLGLNDQTVAALEEATGNRRFAMDSYRRFVMMHGEVVRGIKHEVFENAMDALKAEVGAKGDLDLTSEHLWDLVGRFKKVYAEEVGEAFPETPREQLMQAIRAVFNSWNTERAVAYRKINKIRGLLGTAVNVQCMVYGNMGPTSGTGVLFTRSPATGEDALYGEYLVNAQGEDVVAGIRTPQPIAKLKDEMPEVYEDLYLHVKRLERHFKNVQDCEFTVQDGKLFILQTRDGKRTGAAALKIAVDMVKEHLVSKRYAVEKLVTPAHIDQLLHPRFRDEEGYRSRGAVVTKGLGASPGAAVGQVIMDADEALAASEDGRDVILVRLETSAEDVKGMHAARGILTARGGMTSHAAVVARGWGKPCVCGCKDISIDYKAKTFSVGGKTIKEGDWVSLQGTTGEVVLGKEETVPPELSDDLQTFMQWTNRVGSPMKVRANADTPEDVGIARKLGATGVGLVRTEHQFFAEDRIWSVREMILAETEEARRAALDKLFVLQRRDFYGIYAAMGGGPVTIRLLDPPLHEFIPKEAAAQEEMARRLGVDVDSVRRRVEHLTESNPMLGHRGCRLGITHPEITEMQVRAMLDAACSLAEESKTAGSTVHVPVVEIMVPLVATVTELRNQKALIDAAAKAVIADKGVEVPYTIGTMIETPRAAITAATIAGDAAFFSFGTNDLTQMTFGFSRDDVTKFLPRYLDLNILKDDPFQTIDVAGVGQLVKMAVDGGRATTPGLKVGVCGEHGGDVRSAEFFYASGLNYVSCSPFRVPLAKLASAQAHIKAEAAGTARLI